MKRNPARRSRTLVLGLVLLAVAGGCGPGNEYAAPPPPPVTVSPPELREITRFADYTGTTRAVESVDVRARVQGFLQSIHFEPGDVVSTPASATMEYRRRGAQSGFGTRKKIA